MDHLAPANYPIDPKKHEDDVSNQKVDEISSQQTWPGGFGIQKRETIDGKTVYITHCCVYDCPPGEQGRESPFPPCRSSVEHPSYRGNDSSPQKDK